VLIAALAAIGFGRWTPHVDGQPVFQYIEPVRVAFAVRARAARGRRFKRNLVLSAAWMHRHGHHDIALELAIDGHDYDQIEAAARRKNLSISAVSELATGNPSAFKNLREAQENRKRRSAVDNLKRFADVLGLEFYLGPERVGHLQEQAAKFSVEIPLDIRWIPLDPHQAQALATPPPLDRLAVPRSFLKDLGIAASSATLVVATDDAMAPAIGQGATAILDTSDKAMDDTGAIRAVMIGTMVKLRRIEQGPDWIIARPDNPRTPIDSIPRRHAGTITILGRVRAVISAVA